MEETGVGIDEKLVRVEAVSVSRLIRAVHTVTIELARTYAGDVAVPDLISLLRK
jgi:hypothetical protein